MILVNVRHEKFCFEFYLLMSKSLFELCLSIGSFDTSMIFAVLQIIKWFFTRMGC